jgi:hypothetical protein
MGYHRMSDDEVHEFLTREPARPGILRTTRADGRPHVAPVWYCVDDDTAPFSFVVLEGPVVVSLDLDEVRSWAARIGARDMGADRADEYGAATASPVSC